MYFKAIRQSWFIGPTIGDDLYYIEYDSTEFCAEEFVNTSWYEKGLVSNQLELIQSETVHIQCLDDISCSCQNLDVSGFEFQLPANGHYVMTNSTIDGRKCYIDWSKLLILSQSQDYC